MYILIVIFSLAGAPPQATTLASADAVNCRIDRVAVTQMMQTLGYEVHDTICHKIQRT